MRTLQFIPNLLQARRLQKLRIVTIALLTASVVWASAASGESEQDLLDLEASLEALQALDEEIAEIEAQPSEAETATDARELEADQAEQERREAEAQVRAAIAEELDFQSNLLDSTRQSASAEELLRDADPRAAPRAPEPRELPLAIFDQEDASIPPGTWGNRKRLKLVRLTLDADGNGKPELTRYVDRESKLPVREEEDRNYDGVLDSWSDFEWGAIVARVLDSNDDGNPDVWEVYADGRMTSRETDRDDDGIRDAFYKYTGDSLREERHDSNNDSQIDLIIIYEDRLRISAEEDHDTNGQMDTWTTYVAVGGREVVARIERDKRGEGSVTIVEVFDTNTGEAVIKRKDEDVNGDGEIDVVSIYRNGKLVRREISDPHLVEL